ncbi:hypothetical protein GWK47_005640 [Chionoecetes opilio]|uniref:Uncharacterized protein n=1 Tax=Chionoecetes opilio TaxID=41210 RepID=A0A8J5CJI1_CHIOP|nr:hypothetical protein GWK47_005640 [Chionoecetes opilio]
MTDGARSPLGNPPKAEAPATLPPKSALPSFHLRGDLHRAVSIFSLAPQGSRTPLKTFTRGNRCGPRPRACRQGRLPLVLTKPWETNPGPTRWEALCPPPIPKPGKTKSPVPTGPLHPPCIWEKVEGLVSTARFRWWGRTLFEGGAGGFRPHLRHPGRAGSAGKLFVNLPSAQPGSTFSRTHISWGVRLRSRPSGPGGNDYLAPPAQTLGLINGLPGSFGGPKPISSISLPPSGSKSYGAALGSAARLSSPRVPPKSALRIPGVMKSSPLSPCMPKWDPPLFPPTEGGFCARTTTDLVLPQATPLLLFTATLVGPSTPVWVSGGQTTTVGRGPQALPSLTYPPHHHNPPNPNPFPPHPGGHPSKLPRTFQASPSDSAGFWRGHISQRKGMYPPTTSKSLPMGHTPRHPSTAAPSMTLPKPLCRTWRLPPETDVLTSKTLPSTGPHTPPSLSKGRCDLHSPLPPPLPPLPPPPHHPRPSSPSQRALCTSEYLWDFAAPFPPGGDIAFYWVPPPAGTPGTSHTLLPGLPPSPGKHARRALRITPWAITASHRKAKTDGGARQCAKSSNPGPLRRHRRPPPRGGAALDTHKAGIKTGAGSGAKLDDRLAKKGAYSRSPRVPAGGLLSMVAKFCCGGGWGAGAADEWGARDQSASGCGVIPPKVPQGPGPKNFVSFAGGAPEGPPGGTTRDPPGGFPSIPKQLSQETDFPRHDLLGAPFWAPSKPGLFFQINPMGKINLGEHFVLSQQAISAYPAHHLSFLNQSSHVIPNSRLFTCFIHVHPSGICKVHHYKLRNGKVMAEVDTTQAESQIYNPAWIQPLVKITIAPSNHQGQTLQLPRHGPHTSTLSPFPVSRESNLARPPWGHHTGSSEPSEEAGWAMRMPVRWLPAEKGRIPTQHKQTSVPACCINDAHEPYHTMCSNKYRPSTTPPRLRKPSTATITKVKGARNYIKHHVKCLGVHSCDDANIRQPEKTVKKARKNSRWILRNISFPRRGLHVNSWKALDKTRLDYCSQLWSPHTSRQKYKPSNQVPKVLIIDSGGMKNLNYWERLQSWGLLTTEAEGEIPDIISLEDTETLAQPYCHQ